MPLKSDRSSVSFGFRLSGVVMAKVTSDVCGILVATQSWSIKCKCCVDRHAIWFSDTPTVLVTVCIDSFSDWCIEAPVQVKCCNMCKSSAKGLIKNPKGPPNRMYDYEKPPQKWYWSMVSQWNGPPLLWGPRPAPHHIITIILFPIPPTALSPKVDQRIMRIDRLNYYFESACLETGWPNFRGGHIRGSCVSVSHSKGQR